MLVHPTAHPTGGSSTVWMLWLDLSLSQFGWGKGSAAEPLPLAELQPAMSRKSTAVMCGLHVYSWCTRIEGMNHDPFGHGGSLKEAGNTIMAQQDPLDGVSRALHSAADGLACTLRGAAEKLNSFSSHAQGVQGAWDACAGALQRGIAQHRSQVAPRPPPLFASIRSSGNGSSNARRGTQGGSPAEGKKATVEEDRVLISEVLIKDKDGGDLDDVELARAAADALKVSKPNAVLTRRDVQDDVHRIIDTGYFASCMPTAEDTRDGVRLIYKIEPNQEMKGLTFSGASVLPARVIEDAFKNEYGKVVNIQRLNNVLDAVNGWYSQRGLFGQVADVELTNGVVTVKVAESQVNSISIKFRDKKTGEPTTGKTRPETILRQLMTKKGQVYCLPQGRRDVETVFTMGIMEDVNLVPQPAADGSGNVDLTFNVVERVAGGFSAGGGLSGSSISGGALSGLIGSFAYSHRNMFGKNQKLNVSVERGQFDSMFKFNYTDPWIDGDDKRTSRSINIQNSRSPGMTVHGVRRDNQSAGGSPWQHGVITIGRLIAGVDYSRPIRPRWNGSAGLSFQRAGARDDHGHPRLVDAFGAPLTFSGRAVDDMLVGKLELVYTDSAADSSSSQLVISSEQAIPIAPEWLYFNRVNVRARKGLCVGPARCTGSFSGGTVVGDLAPHEAFPIGGTNSVRGYDEGAVGSGRSYIVSSAEISFPMFGPLEGALFADFGTDLGSGETVLGNPAGARGKPGQGFGVGAGVRVDSPLGPLRLEYALNDQQARRFHFGIGYRN